MQRNKTSNKIGRLIFLIFWSTEASNWIANDMNVNLMSLGMSILARRSMEI